MIYKIEYYSGAGNLFSILDNREKFLDLKNAAEFAKVACMNQDKYTIQTEGLIIIDSNENQNISNSFGVKFYNPDGSSGMMCGNGARCAVKFSLDNQIIQILEKSDSIIFELAGIIYVATLNDELISVKFPPPVNSVIGMEIPSEGNKIFGHYADVGTSHVIFNYEDIPFSKRFEFDYYPLKHFAPQIRSNFQLFPKGTNVSIFKILNRSNVLLRTFEKGVEDETGACGTGAIATASLLYQMHLIESNVNIIPTSKSTLNVDILNEQNSIKGFLLTGKADKIGETNINF